MIMTTTDQGAQDNEHEERGLTAPRSVLEQVSLSVCLYLPIGHHYCNDTSKGCWADGAFLSFTTRRVVAGGRKLNASVKMNDSCAECILPSDQ
jgi:hypothetical protein